MRIPTRLAGASAALALTATTALTFGASPVVAQEQAYAPVAGWQVQDTRIGPNVDWSDCDPGPAHFPAALSAIASDEVVGLTTPVVAAPPHYGTSIETADLGLAVSAGDVVTVDYALLEGAKPDNDAVRLFIYGEPDANADCTEPSASVAAPDDGTTSGTLEIVLDYDGKIGTAGMVYDSSNGGVGGTVRFVNLTVGDRLICFCSPEPEPTPGPTVAPTEEPTAEPTPGPSASPTPGGVALPDTGSGWVLPIALAGALAVLVGVVLLLVNRSSRQPKHFTTS